MIIGINGFKGAGKDTVGKFIVANYGFTRLGYADKLKESFAAIFDIPVEYLDQFKNDPNCLVAIGWKNAPQNLADAMWSPMVSISLREALKRYGTEAHREVFWDSFWIDVLMMKVSMNDNLVITDVRFQNEMEDIRRSGGYIIRVERPGLEQEDHKSEKIPSPELIDFYIQNDDTFDWLFTQVADVMTLIAQKERERIGT